LLKNNYEQKETSNYKPCIENSLEQVKCREYSIESKGKMFKKMGKITSEVKNVHQLISENLQKSSINTERKT
jgi:hypothetical protein